MSNFKVHQTVELKIERLSYKFGKGVARSEGLVFFVENALPGDVVRAKISSVKKKFVEASAIEIIQESPYRIDSKCPVHTTCGGCTLQAFSYEQEIIEKQQIIEFTFSKFKQLFPDLKILPLVTGSTPYFYRNRIQIHKKGTKLGFLAHKTHKVIDIGVCAIAAPELNEALNEIKNNNVVDGRYELYLTPKGKVEIFAGKKPSNVALFSQVNNEINIKLQQKVLSTVKDTTASYFYDLYCGQGNFSFLLAEKHKEAQIIGVELSSEAIKIAKSLNKLPNLQFKAEDCADFIAGNNLSSDSIIILDPPRAGCDKSVLSSICNSNASQVIYISCDLGTLKRDLDTLSETYKIDHIQGFDMFPRTAHIECFVSLSLKHTALL